MKRVHTLIFAIIVSAVFIACEEQDVPTAEGTLLDFEVPDTPPEVNYLVGAPYSRFDWSNNLYETPSIGFYDALNGDTDAYDQHITWANQAGIDFFMFELRSAVVPASFQQDSTFVATLLGSSAAASQNFAISYNFNEMGISASNRIDVEADLLGRMVNDFVAMGGFFSQSNYQAAGDGSAIVYIQGADGLFAEDYVNVFDTLRSVVNTQLGVNLYLVAEQQPWTPPMRFEPKFKDGVDAVSHFTYAQINASANAYDYDRYILFEQYADLALTFASEELMKIDLEYIPQVAPSYDASVQNPASTFFQIHKEEEWFRTYCDIAKRASGNNPNNIIILNSFNNWNFNTQIEPEKVTVRSFLIS